MKSVINIYNLKINSISSNGSVNIGEALQVTAHTAHSKPTGTNFLFMAMSHLLLEMQTIYIDPDTK